MTVSEYAKKEEECKWNTIGTTVGSGQCWDLVQLYVTQYLGVPEWVLAGCGYVNNLLYPPKINDVLEYFDEVPMTQMLKGDMVIWEAGHIAIFDLWDGENCIYLTQNRGTGEQPIGGVYLSSFNLGEAHAFRLKGIMPDPVSKEINVGDTIRINTIPPYKYYVADETKVLWGIYQIRENENAGGADAFTWRDNGIPEICVDLVDDNGNKLPDSDYTHCVAGDKFVFARNFKVMAITYDNGMRYLYLDFDNNPDNRFWVVDKYCEKI